VPASHVLNEAIVAIGDDLRVVAGNALVDQDQVAIRLTADDEGKVIQRDVRPLPRWRENDQ